MSKPLGMKCYGSIPHLSFSRLGPGDHYCHAGQERIATGSVIGRDPRYKVIVQIKLDGSNVGVARINGELVPLVRKGYTALSSGYEMHHLFHAWAMDQAHRLEFLKEGERLVGEWLAQAHGTRYRLPHDPFVPFDWFTADNKRACYDAFEDATAEQFTLPSVLHRANSPLEKECLLHFLSLYDKVPHHGDLEPCEGAVFRVERGGRVLFLCKYVRPEKIDGKYLNQGQEIWNWRPTELVARYQP